MKVFKYIGLTYKNARDKTLSKDRWKNVFKFLSLPELKFLKTCSFIATILF